MSSAGYDMSKTGIALAVGGNLLVSVSLNLTKHAHNTNLASAEPKPYVKLPLWWVGFVTTLLGEFGNFAAYGFTEASIIAPLGAVSVLANAFIAALLLGEGLRMRDLLGCFLCILGGVIIVVSSPTSGADIDIDHFMKYVQDPAFMAYMGVLSAVVAVLLAFQDTYGHRHVGYYVLLCSLLGSVTVMSCKGVSTFLTLWIGFGADDVFSKPVFYLLLLILIATAILQLRYLNIAMEHFGNTETVPVYYVLFTMATIVGSNVLYKDFEHEDRWMFACFCAGCLLTFGGVKLLTAHHSQDDDDKCAALIDSEQPSQSCESISECNVLRPAPASVWRRMRSWAVQVVLPRRRSESLRTGASLLSLQALTTPSTPTAASAALLRRTFSTFVPPPSATYADGYSTL